MATYGDYRPYQNDIDPNYQRVLQTYLRGEMSDPVRQALEQERQRGMATIQESYGGRGAPSGAMRTAQERFLTEMAMKTGLAGQQNQLYGLQYGMPYMQYGAQQYWRPYEMGQQQQQLDINQQLANYQTQEQPWYLQALGGLGGLIGDVATPWAWSKFTGSNTGGKP